MGKETQNWDRGRRQVARFLASHAVVIVKALNRPLEHSRNLIEVLLRWFVSTSRFKIRLINGTVFQQSAISRQSFAILLLAKLFRENTFKVSRPRVEIKVKLLLLLFLLPQYYSAPAFVRIFARNKWFHGLVVRVQVNGRSWNAQSKISRMTKKSRRDWMGTILCEASIGEWMYLIFESTVVLTRIFTEWKHRNSTRARNRFSRRGVARVLKHSRILV